MKWVNIQTATKEGAVGYLGLCANPADIDYGIVTPEPVGESYISKLKAADIIESEMFSLSFRFYADTTASYADFGYFDTNSMNEPTDLVWISNESISKYNKFYWNASVQGFRIRTTSSGQYDSTRDLAGSVSYSFDYDHIGIIDSEYPIIFCP